MGRMPESTPELASQASMRSLYGALVDRIRLEGVHVGSELAFAMGPTGLFLENEEGTLYGIRECHDSTLEIDTETTAAVVIRLADTGLYEGEAHEDGVGYPLTEARLGELASEISAARLPLHEPAEARLHSDLKTIIHRFVDDLSPEELLEFLETGAAFSTNPAAAERFVEYIMRLIRDIELDE
jgi:hypothetical protein